MAAAAAGSSKWEWMAEVEEKLSEADASVEVSGWWRHSIYRVPACIKDLNPKAYRPQAVSLGPFHHGDERLRPMEEHKRRALRHLLRRTGRPLREFAAAVEEVAEELHGAYRGLDAVAAEWCGGDDEGGAKFLEMMVVDGCFLLEVMRAAGAASGGNFVGGDYAPNDPIFSRHGVLYVVPYIRRDMLMLENQLPLLLLAKLLTVEAAKPANDDTVNRMVLRFLSPSPPLPPAGAGLGLHPLDVFRRSMLHGPYHTPENTTHHAPASDMDIIRPATDLHEAGVRFKKSATDSLHDIRFRRGVLSMPAMSIDDATQCTLLNMMAFERLHAGTGNDVTAYVFFMDNILRTAKDVALLDSTGIIQNAIGSDEAVAALFHGAVPSDAVIEPENALLAVHRRANAHCRRPWNVWRASIARTTYFRSPTSVVTFVAASIVVLMIVVQTIFTVVSFYKG
ncbi:hypothetical protein EJB05_26364, partial [Eragrostis curvula]